MKLAKFTNGYAYAYQLLGDILFSSKDYSLSDQNIQKFDEIIYERAYSIIFSELTDKEREILLAAIDNQSNDYIIKTIGFSKSQLSNYKNILFKKGIIDNDSKSIIFSLPRFKECLIFEKEIDSVEI